MQSKILQMIIASAGPKLAAALAQAIVSYLAKVAQRTDTQIDDDLVEIIARAVDQLEKAETIDDL